MPTYSTAEPIPYDERGDYPGRDWPLWKDVARVATMGAYHPGDRDISRENDKVLAANTALKIKQANAAADTDNKIKDREKERKALIDAMDFLDIPQDRRVPLMQEFELDYSKRMKERDQNITAGAEARGAGVRAFDKGGAATDAAIEKSKREQADDTYKTTQVQRRADRGIPGAEADAELARLDNVASANEFDTTQTAEAAKNFGINSAVQDDLGYAPVMAHNKTMADIKRAIQNNVNAYNDWTTAEARKRAMQSLGPKGLETIEIDKLKTDGVKPLSPQEVIFDRLGGTRENAFKSTIFQSGTSPAGDPEYRSALVPDPARRLSYPGQPPIMTPRPSTASPVPAAVPVAPGVVGQYTPAQLRAFEAQKVLGVLKPAGQ